MRPIRLLLFAIALLIPAAPASAAVPHTVQPGETLWSIAAANNLTTRTVAAFNGVSEDHQVVLGSTIMVPTTVEGYASLQQAGLVAADPAQAAAPVAAPTAQGGYTVRAGDNLMDGSVKSINQDTVIFSQDVSDPLSLVKQREVAKPVRQAEGRG